MRKTVASFVFCAVFVIVASQKPYDTEQSDEDQQIAEFNSYEEYLECVQQGACPQSEATAQPPPAVSPSAEPETEQTTYSKLCEAVTGKLFELESRHPELKAAKTEFLKRLTLYFSAFDSKCAENESIIGKMLDFVVLIAEKLKGEFGRHKRPLPVVEVSTPVEEIVAEEVELWPGFVGSVRGIPGVHYPNYTEVPITSFSCSDKKYIPGFYADLETGCQVFHVCYEHRRESFLCPLGTTFNQPILACDYWYSSNCSQAPIYFDVNEKSENEEEASKDTEEMQEIISTLIEKKPLEKEIEPEGELSDLLKFLPVKSKVVEFPSKPKDKAVLTPILAAAKSLPMKKLVFSAAKTLPMKKLVFATAKALPVKKIKLAAKLFPATILAKGKVVGSVKTAAVAGAALTSKAIKAKSVAGAALTSKAIKAKSVAGAALTSKAIKAKTVAGAALTSKAIKAKTVAGATLTSKAIKAKSVAGATLTSKAAKAKTAAVLLKTLPATKMSKLSALPLAKFKYASIPIVKTKKIKAAIKPKLAVAVPGLMAKTAISPLTTKALAIGYKKLLKAKKLALMG